MHDDDWTDEPLARGKAERRDESGEPAGGSESEGPADAESAEEAAWREIVANFGERAVLDDEPPASDGDQAPFVVRFSSDRDDRADEADEENRSDPQDYFVAEPIHLDGEERYVPPPPPPLPRTTPARFLAWLGVLGTPVLAVLLVTVHAVTGFVVPSWLIAFMVVGFLGGFGYLLATMSRDPGDPWDDGARL